MHNYYVRFGRRHKFPSTAEILDELRADLVPGYVRKSQAQHGFTKPASTEPAEIESLAPAVEAEPIATRSSPLVYPRFTTHLRLVR
jgi:hypothetical protein